jgi:mannose-6-phosphate isomerase-like protein (cupin superfamily)
MAEMTAQTRSIGSGRADSPHRVAFDTIPWESPVECLRVKVSVRRGRRLRLVEYTPAMAAHWCEEGHLGYILEGRLEVCFPGETVVFGPGDGVVIPAGPEHRHMGRALTEVVRVVFVEDV